MFGSFCLRAQLLPEGWSQHISAEEILAKAKAITESVPYIKASKSKMINDPASGFVIFQRRMPDGKIETKNVRTLHEQTASITYDVSSGRYFIDDANGVPIKDEFESDVEIETRVANSLITPYQYEMLKPDLAGTNNCLVVRSKMSQEMVGAIAKEFHKAIPKFDTKYIRTIKDFYIRESDGIIVGYIERTASGSIMGDRLADTISVGIPIAPEEFLIPKIDTAIKVDSLDSAVAVSITNMVKDTNQKIENHNPFAIRIVLCVLAIAPIAWFLLRLKFRRRIL